MVLSWRHPPRRRERGGASLLVVAAMGAIMVLTLSGLVLAGVVLATHRARSAADLAALAGAQRLQDAVPAEAACAQAQRVAQRNGAQIQQCAVEGMDVEVTAVVRVRTWPSNASGRARAGPDRDTWARVTGTMPTP